jgi:hypothetical protein
MVSFPLAVSFSVPCHIVFFLNVPAEGFFQQ